jgi:hypothetical protein
MAPKGTRSPKMARPFIFGRAYDSSILPNPNSCLTDWVVEAEGVFNDCAPAKKIVAFAKNNRMIFFI